MGFKSFVFTSLLCICTPRDCTPHTELLLCHFTLLQTSQGTAGRQEAPPSILLKPGSDCSRAESRPRFDPLHLCQLLSCTMRRGIFYTNMRDSPADIFSQTSGDTQQGNKLAIPKTRSPPASMSYSSPFPLLPPPSLSLSRLLTSSKNQSTPTPPLHLMGPLTDSWLWLWLWKMGQSRQQSPPPAFLQHDSALSPRAGARPRLCLPPFSSASPLSFFSCLYSVLSLSLSCCFSSNPKHCLSREESFEFMRAAVCWRRFV